jgi:putative hydrolase of the HAD superfamily
MRAVIFDLDDTLYPEAEWRSSGFDAVAAVLAIRTGIDVVHLRQRIDELDQEPNRSRVFDLLCAELLSEGVSSDPAELVHLFRSHWPEKLSLFPEAGVFLSSAAFPVGLLTDGYWISQLRKIEALGLRSLLSTIVVTDLLAADRKGWKPAVLPFRVALESLCVPAEEAVYVADNPAKDFAGPNALGMKSIWLSGGKLSGSDATWAVSDWGELSGLLAELVTAPTGRGED